jgi:hypothetical protein
VSKVLDKYHSYKKLEADDYWAIHKDFLTPTSIQIDLEKFSACMDKYKEHFKPWGNNRPELNDIRQGLPLVNMHGRYDDPNDISIGPLDQYNKSNPDIPYLENDFVVHTEILSDPAFRSLGRLTEYLCRSSILHWHKGANFLPHYDVLVPTVNLRLWGTNDPSSISLRYQLGDEMIEVANTVEAGRLYLIETSTIHDATCIGEDVYQFFLALNIDSYNIVKLESR